MLSQLSTQALREGASSPGTGVCVVRLSGPWSRSVFVGGDVDEFKVELEGGGNPVTDGGIWLGIRIVEHTFSVACVHLHYEVAGADEMEMQHPKCMEEAVDFEFGLGVARLMFAPGNGAEARGAAVAVETVLRKGVWREVVNSCSRGLRGS